MLRRRILLNILSVLLITLTAVTSVAAWFISSGEVYFTKSGGMVLTNYFHTGTGTEEDPYVITRPIHFANMAMLYQALDGFADDGLYFQIGYDLDKSGDGVLEVYSYNNNGIWDGTYSDTLNMEYYQDDLALLPTGTSSKPFNSVFNGNGFIVSNLHITSKGIIGDTTYTTNDVGIFGYVTGDAVIKDTYFTTFTIDLTDLDSTPISNDDHNQDAHLNSANENVSYVGYLVGHVVGHDPESDTKTCQDVYINDATIIGGNAATCGFGYFGCVENADGSEVETLGSAVDSQWAKGDDAGFGGSIDMLSIYSRLESIFSASKALGYGQYISSETVVVDEVPGGSENKVNETNSKTTVTANNSIRYYYYETDKGGEFNFPSDNDDPGSTANNIYQCLYGASTKYTKTVTTYTYKDDFRDAFYIRDGMNYLGVNGTSFANVTSEAAASKWALDEQGHLYTRIETTNAITTYYLNNNSTTGLTIGTTASSVWHFEQSENNEFTSQLYTVINNINYYVTYNNGWRLTTKDSYYAISAGTNRFLGYDNNRNVVNSVNNNARWNITYSNNNTRAIISTNINGTEYYLNGGNSLTLETASFTWNVNGDTYYFTSNNVDYYLVFDTSDLSWKIRVRNGVTISSGNNYLGIDANNNITTTNTIWQLSSNTGTTQIYTFVNGTRYYLNINNGGLVVNTTAANWTRVNNQDNTVTFHMAVGNKDYYLEYDNGWKVILLVHYLIHDGNGNYLRVTGNNTFASGNEGNATEFYFATENGANSSGKVYCTVNSTVYYLRNNAGTLETSNEANGTAWLNDGNSLYVTANTTDNPTYALQCINGTWSIKTIYNNAYYITDSEGNYLTVTGTTIGNATSVDDATPFIFQNTGANPSGTIKVAGTNYYLRNNGGTLQASTTSTTWANNGTTISNDDYKLVYRDGNWTLYNKYYITDGNGNYMRVTGYTNNSYNYFANTTDINQATEFTFSGSGGTGTITYRYNNNNYYLRSYNNRLAVSTTSTTWSNNGNNLYNGNYKIVYNGDNWVLVGLNDNYTISDGNGNYLRITGTGNTDYTNTTNVALATRFTFSETEDDPHGTISCVITGYTRYLQNYNNNGTLRSSGTSTTWSNDGTNIYNGNYYLVYDNGWKLIQTSSSYTISDGNGNYLRITGTGNTDFTNTTNINQATRFTFSTITGDYPSGTISCSINGSTRYLQNYNNGTLRSSGTSTTWSNDGTNIYNGNYFLVFDNGTWKLTTAVIKYTISDGNGNYLRVTGTGTNDYTNTTDPDAATIFTFSKTGTNPSEYISTVVNNTTVYLRGQRTGTGLSRTYILSITTSENNRTNWSNNNGVLSGSNCYIQLNGTTWRGYSSGTTLTFGAKHYASDGTTPFAYTIETEKFSTYNGNTFTLVTNVNLDPASSLAVQIVPSNQTRTGAIDNTMPVAKVSEIDTDAPSVSLADYDLFNDTNCVVNLTIDGPYLYNVTFKKTKLQIVEKKVETNVKSGNNTYFPLRVDKDENGNYPDGYAASNKNTGYMVSGANVETGTITTNQKKWGDIRVAGWAISNISGSYVQTGLSVSRLAQGGNYLVLTKDANDNYIISNTTNQSEANFWQYSNNKLFTQVGKETYYLNYSNGLKLGTSASGATNWTFSNNNRLASGSNYICYNNGWTTTTTANNANLTLTLGTLNTVYTYDGNGNHALTAAQQTDVYKQAALQLSEVLVGQSKVYGLHFMDAQISMDHIIRAKYVNIFGTEYSDYELLEDSIDFHLIERGTISFFAGEYFTDNDTFFSLHQVFRYTSTDAEVINGTKKANDIKNVLEISEVYKHKTDGDNANYIYKFNTSPATYSNADGTYTGATSLDTNYNSTAVFKTNWITNPSGLSTDNKHIYYFEIPANAGEYCLGSVKGKSGAYLIYLDIGTNGGDAIASAVSAEGNDVVNEFKVEFRDAPNTEDHTILQFSIDVPEVDDSSDFSINVVFNSTDDADPHPGGMYTITVNNYTGEDLSLYIYLCDNDHNILTSFPFAYKVVYSNENRSGALVTTSVGSEFQMMAGFVIPSSGDATEANYTH